MIVRLISGQKTLENTDLHKVVCFSKVRNERLRIQSFLNHHRSIGVEHFIFVDNASDDGTADILITEPDVSLFFTDEEFGKSEAGLKWLHPLLDKYRNNNWALVLDADELFVYPYYEHNDIGKLCNHLNAKGRAAVLSIMLDMYSNKPIKDTVHHQSTSLIDTCPYFDPGPYEIQRNRVVFPFIEFTGGARRRYFCNLDTEAPVPSITKVPLVKWDGRCRYSKAPHYMRPSPGPLSEIVGALLHFKYLDNFYAKAVVESAREQYWGNGAEYKLYKKIMERNPEMSLYYDKSIRFETSMTLLNNNIIKSEFEWDQLCGGSSKFGQVSRNAPPLCS